MKKLSNRSDAREEAYRILLRVEEGAYASRLLQHAAQGFTGNFAFVTQLVKGTLEYQEALDEALRKVVSRPLEKLEKKVIVFLRLGAYQSTLLTDVPREVSVSVMVELSKKHFHSGISSFVNAVLRKVRLSLSENFSSSAMLLPPWLYSRWEREFGKETTQALAESFTKKPPLTLRVNTFRSSVDEVLRAVAHEGVNAQPGRFLSNCITIEELGSKKLHDLSVLREGKAVVQDESSVCAATLLNPKPGERVADLCAAPGGKTAVLAELMKNQGEIDAFELHASRVSLIDDLMSRLGITIVRCRQEDSSELSSEKEYDRVLLDAPCSGLGILGRQKEAKWRRSEEDIHRLSLLQDKLLATASSLVRQGGTLVYSTCSIDKEENEERVEQFLKNFPTWEKVPLPDWIPHSLKTKDGFIRFFPHIHETSGGFAALLRQTGSVSKVEV